MAVVGEFFAICGVSLPFAESAEIRDMPSMKSGDNPTGK